MSPIDDSSNAQQRVRLVPPIPEMVAATGAPSQLGKAPAQIALSIQAPTGPARFGAETLLRRWFLKFENIRSDVRSPAFDVYLNLPLGEAIARHPELQAGVLSMFGLRESSRSTERHPSNGLEYVIEVTDLIRRLSARQDWDPKSLRICLVPRTWDDTIDVEIGRVSLYLE